MANDAAMYEFLQQDNVLSAEERYRLCQQSYMHGNTAPKLQPEAQPEFTPEIHRSRRSDISTPEISMRRSTHKKGSAPKTFLAAAFAMGLLGAVIYGRVQTNEIYGEIARETKEYELVQSENVRMHSDLEAKVAIKSVEEYAEQELGLQQLDQSQIEYIQLQTDDSVEIPDEEKNLFVRIKDKFESFMEYLKG